MQTMIIESSATQPQPIEFEEEKAGMPLWIPGEMTSINSEAQESIDAHPPPRKDMKDVEYEFGQHE
jgi:hypothetical protein